MRGIVLVDSGHTQAQTSVASAALASTSTRLPRLRLPRLWSTHTIGTFTNLLRRVTNDMEVPGSDGGAWRRICERFSASRFHPYISTFRNVWAKYGLYGGQYLDNPNRYQLDGSNAKLFSHPKHFVISITIVHRCGMKWYGKTIQYGLRHDSNRLNKPAVDPGIDRACHAAHLRPRAAAREPHRNAPLGCESSNTEVRII